MPELSEFFFITSLASFFLFSLLGCVGLTVEIILDRKYSGTFNTVVYIMLLWGFYVAITSFIAGIIADKINL